MRGFIAVLLMVHGPFRFTVHRRHSTLPNRMRTPVLTPFFGRLNHQEKMLSGKDDSGDKIEEENERKSERCTHFKRR